MGAAAAGIDCGRRSHRSTNGVNDVTPRLASRRAASTSAAFDAAETSRPPTWRMCMPTAMPATSAPEPPATLETTTRDEPSGSVAVPSVMPSGMRVTLMTMAPLASAAGDASDVAGDASLPNDGEAPDGTAANNPCLAAANVDTAGAAAAFGVHVAVEAPVVPNTGADGGAPAAAGAAAAAAVSRGAATAAAALGATGCAAAAAGAAGAGTLATGAAAAATTGAAAPTAASLSCSSKISGDAGVTPAATSPFSRPISCGSA